MPRTVPLRPCDIHGIVIELSEGLRDLEGVPPVSAEEVHPVEDMQRGDPTRIEIDADWYLQDQYMQYQARRIDVLEKELENQRLRERLVIKSIREIIILMVATLCMTGLCVLATVGLI